MGNVRQGKKNLLNKLIILNYMSLILSRKFKLSFNITEKVKSIVRQTQPLHCINDNSSSEWSSCATDL